MVLAVSNIRAFNMTVDLMTALKKIFSFLMESKYYSVGKIIKLIHAFGNCKEHLDFKYKNDANLRENQEFVEAYSQFNELFKDLQVIIFHYKGSRLETMLTHKQESDEMKRQFSKYISKSEPEETRKKIRGLIQLLPDEFINLKTKNLEFLKKKLQDQLREKFDQNQENLRCDLYGLSGVGI